MKMRTAVQPAVVGVQNKARWKGNRSIKTGGLIVESQLGYFDCVIVDLIHHSMFIIYPPGPVT